MKKLILLAFMLISPVAWGQFLVSSSLDVQALDADLTQWSFPADLRSAVSLPTATGLLFKGPAQSALTVMQGEFAVLSTLDPNFAVLASNGAGPCVMVVLQSLDHTAMAHSHFDALTSTKVSIPAMVNQLRSFSTTPIEATLAGLYSEPGLLRRIVTALHAQGIRNIKFYRSSSIAVDKTGQIYFNGIYSDHVASLKTRQEALSAEVAAITASFNQRIESLLKQQPHCNTECLMDQVSRPLRPLYISEKK